MTNRKKNGKITRWFSAEPRLRKTPYATVAQLVEQLIRNQQVAGSNPASSSRSRLGMTSRLHFLKQNSPVSIAEDGHDDGGTPHRERTAVFCVFFSKFGEIGYFQERQVVL